MHWTPLSFGKHKGRTLPQIALQDPDWLFWAIEEGVFREKQWHLREEAEKVADRATRIRVFQERFKQPMVVRNHYIPDETLPSGGSFEHAMLVSEREPPHRHSFCRPVFDLSIPHQMQPYDKAGTRNLIRALLGTYFDDPSYSLTRKRCEAFFEDDSNFVDLDSLP